MRALVFGFAALWSFSQAAPPQDGPTSAQPRPTFRSGTRLVEVGVVVYDKDRKPVNGLTIEDFRLYDAGHEQRIEFFSIQSDRTAAPPEERASARPDEFSNRLEGGFPGGVTVVLFDRLNTSWENQVYARQQLLKFLEQIDGGDRIGLYLLDGDAVRVLHDFTSDARSLVRALARYRAVTSQELSASESAAIEAGNIDDARLNAELGGFLDSGASRMAEHFGGLRAQATIYALEAVANRLAGIKGRKNLIWVSAGFPLKALEARGLSMSTEINRLTRALNNANVATYGVDARGLIGAFAGPPGARRPSFTTLQTVYTNLDILTITSDETGGRAFYNTNDITTAVRRAVDDARATYVLGYYPSAGTWDGKYHPLRVTVNRPGVDVRHRRGYLAAAVGGQHSERSASLQAAIQSPLQATALELSARIDRAADTSSDVVVTVRVAPGSISLEHVKEHWEGAADLVIAQVLPDGKARTSVEKRVDVRMTAEHYNRMLTDGLSMDATVTLLPDTARLHIVVRDVATGNIGSVIIPGGKIRAIRDP
jgi:VWFA-related protein